MEKYDFGIGLTNNCNFRCKHCYSSRKKIYYIGFEKIRDLWDNIPIKSINFGTGESGLHPQFRKILAYIASKGIKTSLTTNGYTPRLNKLADTKSSKNVLYPRLVGRNKEIKELERLLSTHSHNSVIVVGEPGVGRHAVVWNFTNQSQYLCLEF